jgi:two-component system nitrate/nitrite sensor histidine kinase NarX
MNSVDAILSKFSKLTRFKGLPWVIVGVTLLIALLHEIFQPTWIGAWNRLEQMVFWSVMLVVLMLAYMIVNRALFYIDERDRLQTRIEQAERLIDGAYQRLDAVLRISQRFVQASDENEVIELVLRLSVDLIGASGASFVPLDEHGQPLAAVSHGNLPFPVMNDWVEYLATPSVRNRCGACDAHTSLDAEKPCPLLNGPFSGAIGMFCLPLRRGDQEFGVLNLYMPNMNRLEGREQDFLRTLLDETALALEGIRLRRREMAALRHMQAVREKTDLSSLLEDVHQTLESDFALLAVREPNKHVSKTIVGEFPASAHAFIDGVIQSVMASEEAVVLEGLGGEKFSSSGSKAVLAAPLLSPEHKTMGVLLVGNHSVPFSQRHLGLLQTVAGQVALIVQNANLMAELEYKTMLQERTRLAREIHDGLAQSLGFLKLQAAQLQNYLERSEIDRLHESLELLYKTLSEVYQDARQTIDGLRIRPSDQGLLGWLDETILEFREVSGLSVSLEELDVETELPPEVHAQLIRIVQEALSNIRKHAQANQVWISCRGVGEDLWLEVRDDGLGFSPEDVPGPSRHGLRGMRERAELIGADFQVISRRGEGTVVRVRLPLLGVSSWTAGEINP